MKKKKYLPCTSITVKAPKVILAPLSNFPLTKVIIFSICLLHSCK